MIERLKIPAVGAVLLAATATCFAGRGARVSGHVKDTAGKPIPTAVVTVTTPEMTDFKKVIKVDARGAYHFLLLDATRHYKFHVEAPGYQAMEEPFKVPAGSTDNVFDFTLKTIQEAQQEAQAKVLEEPGFKEFREGKELLDKGDKAGAAAKFREAVKLKPDLVQGWSALATLAYELGDYRQALDDAQKCLELDDEVVQCLAVAANSCKALGKTEKAKEYLERYQKLNPDDPATLFDKAAAFLNKMDDEHARPLLEQCLKADPNYGPCIFQYGMLLLRSGDMTGAKKTLQHYLEVEPNGKQAATVKQTLKYL